MEPTDPRNIAVKGRTFRWGQTAGNGIPPWVAAITDPVEIDQVLAEHINTVMGRYIGQRDR